MTLPMTLVLLTGMLVVGGIATTYQVLQDDDCDPGATAASSSASSGADCWGGTLCPEGPVVPFAESRATSGVVRVDIDNVDRKVAGRVCIVDTDGVKRHESPFEVPAERSLPVDTAVPVARYLVVVSFAPTGLGSGGASTTSGGELDLTGCQDGSMAFPITVRSKSAHEIHARSERGRCIAHPADADGAAAPGGSDGAPPPDGAQLTKWGAAALASAGAGAVLCSVVAARRGGWPGVRRIG